MQGNDATSGPAPGRSRDYSLDILRGLAISGMIFGHLAMEIVEVEGAFYIEALGGTAPVLFLLISGMLVAQAAWQRGTGMRRPLVRGVQLIGVAALLDVAVWRIYPFTTVDVLYVIGLSLPVAQLMATRSPELLRWVVAGAFILAAPPLQALLGYTEYPSEYTFDGELVSVIDLVGVGPVEIANQTNVLNHWLVDGWFPLFPWLGFAVLGVAWARIRWPEVGGTLRFGVATGLLPGLLLMAVAIWLGWLNPEFEATLRRRYGGAFMPPDYAYLLGSIGATAVLFYLVDLRPELDVYRPLRLLGRHALLIYVIHIPIIFGIAILLDHQRVSDLAFGGVFLVLITGLGAVGAGLEAWRRWRRPAPA